MEIGSLIPALLIFLVSAVMIGIGVYILYQVGNSSGLTPAASTVINSTASTYGTLGTTWFPILVIVLGAVLVIGMLLAGFRGGKMGR